MPIAGSDPNNPHIYCISAAVGLPWAAALGRYSAEKILDGKTDFDQYFSPERKFTVPDWAQTIVGKRVAFAVSNWFVGMF